MYLFFHKFLCSSGNQAAEHVGLLIQYYSSFVPSAAQHRGVTLGQIHKGAPSFHLQAAGSSIASCITSTSFIFVPALSSSLHNVQSYRHEIKRVASPACVFLGSKRSAALPSPAAGVTAAAHLARIAEFCADGASPLNGRLIRETQLRL